MNRIEPLRTRERAAIDAVRAILRNIAQNGGAKGGDECSEMAAEALERIAIILGERT